MITRAVPKGSRSEWRILLTGTAVTSVIGGLGVIIVALTSQDLALTPTGLPIVWIPVVIFALSGGPLAGLLRRYADRKRSTETSVMPQW